MDNYKEFHKYLMNTNIKVREVMLNDRNFNITFNELYNYLKMGFEEKRVRCHPLKYSFNELREYEMELRHFVVNMIMWYPMCRMNLADKLDETFVFDCTTICKKTIMKFFNNKIIEPYREKVSSVDLNLIFADTIYKLGQISLDFNEILATSINIQTFIDLEAESKTFSNLIHTKIDPRMQPIEIEKFLNEKQNKLVNLLKKYKNGIQPIVMAGEGLKSKQLTELLIAGGLRPDMIGNTIPIPIDSSFLRGGLNSIKNFYIDKQAGRKAVVANKTLMGNAGHFAAKIMKITKDTRVDFSVKDCHTLSPISYTIKTDDHLKIINRSFYIDDDEKLKVINYDKDKHLIGKVIMLRLPVTCGLSDNHVCLTCYGEMYKVNDSPDFGHGSYASAISANKYQQDTLSTKHLQTTNSVNIEFAPIFYDVFDIDSGIISIDPNDIEDPKRWEIKINTNKLVEFDEDDFNSYTDEILIIDKYAKAEYVIKEKNGNQIFLYQDILEKFKHEEGYISLDVSKIEEEISLGVVIVENNELSKPLNNMQLLLDTKDHFNCYTIADLVNRAADLILEADMNVMLVHMCMTLKNLIRDYDDIYKYPEFSVYKNPDYVILRLTDALVNNPSLTTGLASQNLRTQFSNPKTYNKHGKASTDVYFRKSLK